MDTQKKLSVLQDDHRSKQLDEREKLILQKEALLNDEDLLTRVDILDKRIAVKEGIIDELSNKISHLESQYASAKESNKIRIDKLDDRLKAKRDELNSFDTLIEKTKRSLRLVREEKADLQNSIAQLEKYQKEQEEVTNRTINQWNNQLKDFKEEDKAIRAEKDTILRDTIRLGQEKSTLQNDIDVLVERHSELDTTYSEHVSSYKAELAGLRDSIQKGEQDILEIEQKNAARIAVMETKEKSLAIKESSLIERELNLSMREKKLDMRLGLSGISLE